MAKGPSGGAGHRPATNKRGMGGGAGGPKGRGAKGGMGGGGGTKKGACDMWIPIAIPAILFYALPRMFFDYLRSKRA